MKFHISIIGAGNVATQLGVRLFDCGHAIHQVYSRTFDRAFRLASMLQAQPIIDLQNIDDTVDIIIIAVRDDAISEVARKLSFLKKAIIVHTSGATPSTVFQAHFKTYGVFYPLQTFSIDKKADFEKLPICIDAGNKESLGKLTRLAESISPNVQIINDRERAILHVCAVLVNNFTNHLIHLSEKILSEEKINSKILLPLIQETILKLANGSAYDMQTGPARRGDRQTIGHHVEFLERYPKVQTIYKLLSESILTTYIERDT